MSRRLKWTLERFLERAKEIHKDAYDYSQVREEHIRGHKSRVPVKCKLCSYQWSPIIGNHIYGKYGCPDCAGNVPWTLERFLKRAKEIHKDAYNYSQVREERIRGQTSKVPLKCNSCSYEWSPTIGNHINNKSGCPECADKVPWTLERFLVRATQVHGNIYNYSQVKEEHIQGKTSKIPLKCNMCLYEWAPPIASHINGKNGCPNCSGKVPWTLERLLDRAKEIHGNAYNYDQIREEDIKGDKSKIPLKCNTCLYEWAPIIGSHINSKSGCPNCAANVSWTLEKFLDRAKEIHGNAYDYSQIREEHIRGHKSRIPLKCNTCMYEWTPVINSHINMKSGCPSVIVQKENLLSIKYSGI